MDISNFDKVLGSMHGDAEALIEALNIMENEEIGAVGGSGEEECVANNIYESGTKARDVSNGGT